MAERLLLGPLNNIGRAAADGAGWHYVDGIAAAFAKHGYCARPSWITHLGRSFLLQGGGTRVSGRFVGVLHPNEEGHRRIASIAAPIVCGYLDPSAPLHRACPSGRMIPAMAVDHSVSALIVAAVALLLILLAAWLVRRKIILAVSSGSYQPPQSGGSPPPDRTVTAGDLMPLSDRDAAEKAGINVREKKLRLLRGLFMGADNRLSTSKTVVALWTLAIFYGLLALMLARWFGDPSGWKALTKHGLQDEYLLLLGGPYAAAVLAKYQASSDETKTSASPGTTTPKDLVANDSGEADLGDFQFLLFNLLALSWYLGELLPHLRSGMPDLPSLLSGLALVTAGGYTAKKFVGQAMPTLASIVPAEVLRGENDHIPPVDIWGNNLVVPSLDGKQELSPTVVVANMTATVQSVQRTLGRDRLSVTLPDGAPNERPLAVSVFRADGLAAAGPAGTGGLTVTIRPHA
jgi:hypothetical protein